MDYITIHRTIDPWPEAISDGLLSPCWDCGGTVLIDYQISYDAWRRVSKSASNSVICLSCLISRDKTVIRDLVSLQVSTYERTMVFVPDILYEWKN